MPRTLDNWIKAYLLYTAETESPEDFHIWVGLSTIAGTIRRRVYVDMGYFLLYPNLYIVLTAPQGRCRKTTALRLGRELLEQVPDARFSADSQSREKLAMDMQAAYIDGQSALTAYSSELGSFFTTSGGDMAMFLTDIFDCPTVWSHKTKTGGSTKIKAPFLNLAAATTPDWMAEAISLRTVGLGFTGRVIFVYHDTPRPAKPIPSPSPETKELSKYLVNDLTHIATLQGEFTFTPESKKFYEAWYLARFADGGDIDPRVSGYYERKHIHVLKAAMLLSLGQKDDLVLTIEDLRMALAVLAEAETRMVKAFSAVGKNPLSQDIELIGATVLRHPEGVTDAELMETYRYTVDREQLGQVMDILQMIGYVKSAIRKDGRVVFFPKNAPKEVVEKSLASLG